MQVDLEFEGPGPQRRWTVAFRFILAFPHLLYMAILVFVAYLAVIVGWFCALVTGHLPQGIHNFVANVLRYAGSVLGYGEYLLTDQYPRFDLDDDPSNAVRTRLPERVKLNRAAVLIRLILVIPAGIVATLASSGVGIAIFFVWLLVFVSGRMPVSLFEALAATLRYQARFYAYFAMLTPEYPRGIFGDKVPPSSPDWDAEAPADLPMDDDGEVTDVAVDPFAAPLSRRRPMITKLVLSKAAKRIVVLFLVLGAASNAFAVVNAASTGKRIATAEDFEATYVELTAAAVVYGGAAQRCAASGGMECLQEASRELLDAVEVFHADLQELDIPEDALDEAADLDDTTAEFEALLNQMVDASDPTEMQSLVADFQRIAAELDQRSVDLYNAIAGTV